MTGTGRALALALALSVLPGCCWTHLVRESGSETLVVVVPSRHDGHVGAVVVHDGDRAEVLNTAYAAARVSPHGAVSRTTLTPQETQRVFADASDALPRKPATFMLYFVLASEDLTPESKTTLDASLAEIAARPDADVEVVGHTDRMGTDENNDALSLKRAQHVRDLLIARGAQAQRIRATGMGEREPVVDTPDGVAEARNRRVEIVVR